MRVVCELPSDPRWHLGPRHGTDPVCLAIGQPGLDPDLLSSPEGHVLLIDTHITLTARLDGTFDITGPYVDGPRDTPTLTLRWGTRTSAGHFLLLTGAQLHLPRITAQRTPRDGRDTPAALILTLAMTDPHGERLRGVIVADDLSWQMTSLQRRDRSAATTNRQAMFASTAPASPHSTRAPTMLRRSSSIDPTTAVCAP